MPDPTALQDAASRGGVPVAIRIGGPKLVAALGAIPLIFAALDLVSQAPRYFASSAFPGYQRLDRMFHLGREANIPAWFSGVVLLAAAGLLLLVAVVKRRRSDPFRWHWAALAVLFTYLSADEVAVLHEQLSSMLAPYTFSALNYGGWVGYGVVAVCLLGVLFLPLFLSLPVRTRVLFALAATMFTVGAIGVEVLALPYENGRPPDFAWAVLVALEETLEMSGAIVFVGGIVDYMCRASVRLELRFGVRDSDAIGEEPAAR
jgi:hypothetical protein